MHQNTNQVEWVPLEEFMRSDGVIPRKPKSPVIGFQLPAEVASSYRKTGETEPVGRHIDVIARRQQEDAIGDAMSPCRFDMM